MYTGGIITIAMLSLIVNIIGFTFFREHAKPRSEVRHAHEENIYIIMVHSLLDVIGNIGVIISAIVMPWGVPMADSIVACGIIFLMVCNALPICQRTGKILLQTTPLSIKDQLDKALREASTLEGVLECRDEHFWTQSPGVFVGSVSVRVRSDANEQVVLSRVSSIFRPMITHLTVQVEKDDWMLPTAH